jgi:hypothetical protein
MAAGGGRVKQRRRLDLGPPIWIHRLRTRACARPAASSRGRRRAAVTGGGEARDRVRGSIFVHGKHRGGAREAAKPSTAAQAATTRRRQRMARRGRAARRQSFGELSTAARCTRMSTSGSVGFLTSLHDSGRLHDDEEATAGNGGVARVRVPAVVW